MNTTLLQKVTQPRNYNGIVLIIATIAMSGSLYFSEVLHLYPCKLCWFQRILIYPLVTIGIYSLITDRNLYGLVGFLSGSALLVSGYHSVIQRTSDGICGGTCSVIQYTVGPFTIPNLAFIASVLIVTTTAVSYWLSSD